MSILENELKRFDNMKEELQKKQKQIAEGGSNASRLKASLLVCLSPPYAFTSHIPLCITVCFCGWGVSVDGVYLWMGYICGWDVSVDGVYLWLGCICGWGAPVSVAVCVLVGFCVFLQAKSHDCGTPFTLPG